MKRALRYALLAAVVCGADAGATEPKLDARRVEEQFQVALEPGATLHGRLVRLDSVGDFAAHEGQCIVAVDQGKPVEGVEVIHREALFDTKAYGVTQHTFVLLRNPAQNTYLVMDVVIRETWTTRDPVFGAMREARALHEVYRTRLQHSLRMSAHCPPSMTKAVRMLETLSAALR